MKRIFTLLLLATFSVNPLLSQVVTADLDINNVRATFLNRGDMFWNPSTGAQGYEFPKGSGKHSNFVSALWIGGYDGPSNTLKVAAQTYRQNGNDYWSGPLDSSGSSSATAANDWNKIWKVDKSTIDSFIDIPLHTLSNTHPSILEWPAIGNVHAKGKNGVSLTITKDMAPFVDMNSDGLYNCLDGDYPYIKGDQALWWVFNDVLPHSQSHSSYIGLQIRAEAFACTSTSWLNNIVFVNYLIDYYGTSTFDSTHLSIFCDMDLGYAWNDYVGCDTNRRMAIGYNGTASDPQYGTSLTQHACIILHSPLDSPGYKQPLGACTYHTNLYANSPMGNPNAPMDYYRYMTGTWKDGLNFTDACNARGPGQATKTIFTDDPSVSSGFSEKACNNVPDDRRFILSTSKITLTPGMDPIRFNVAFLNTDEGSDNDNFNAITNVSMVAINNEDGCSFSLPNSLFNHVTSNIEIYPNPASYLVDIKNIPAEVDQIKLYSVFGQSLITLKRDKENMQVNIRHLPAGIYVLQFQSDKGIVNKKLIKN